MQVFRITDTRFVADPLSGLGAALAGARNKAFLDVIVAYCR